MFQDSSIQRVHVLGHQPDADLVANLNSLFPQAEFAHLAGNMEAWSASLWQHAPDGLVLFPDTLEVADLRAVGAWSAAHSGRPFLLVVGGRGLAGGEGLLTHSACRILPLPWTPAALRAVLELPTPTLPLVTPQAASPAPEPEAAAPGASEDDAGPGTGRLRLQSSTSGRPVPGTRPVAARSERPAARDSTISDSADPGSADDAGAAHLQFSSDSLPTFSSEFLDGLVERFRDPLASLSGYLQLLESRQEASPELIQPALAAAREMDGMLEILHLAAGDRMLHPTRLSAEQLAIDALKEAQKCGIEVSLDRQQDFRVRADARLAQAALLVARTLLDRFGGGTGLALSCKQLEEGAALYWDVVDAPLAPESSAVAPPPFLEQLLARLGERLGADSVVHSSHGGAVPRRAGLVWPSRVVLAAAL